MKSVKFLIVISVVSLFLNACKKDKEEYHLTDEQKKQALYYTYNEGDTLFFLRNNTDTISLTISYIYFNKSYGTYFGATVGESIDIYLNGDNYYARINTRAIGGVETQTNGIIEINFCGLVCERKPSGEIISTLNVDSITYNNVYVYTSKTQNSSIYANEKYGIIKVENDTVSYTLIL